MAHTMPSFTPTLSSSAGVNNSNFLLPYTFKCYCHRKTLPADRYKLPMSTSLNLFPQLQSGWILQSRRRKWKPFSSGTDVALEESDVSQADVETPENTLQTSEKSKFRSKRSRPVRKSDMPSIKNEELVPGATFTGKVRSIQPFGAFVDFGAFTDGLVHVSQLSDSYVKDVANVVTVGQEVKVRLVEANMDTGRISLTMRENDDSNKQQQQKSAPVNGDKSKAPRKTGPRNTQNKDEVKKFSKFVKGQELLGTVKNLTRAGAFISLPEGEEGFLPTSEEAEEGFGNMMGVSSLEVDQEVNVRVLRITRGQVTLTMKKQEDYTDIASKLNQGVVYKATNPFEMAFRSNIEMSSFLDERKKGDEILEDVPKDAISYIPTDAVLPLTEASENEELDSAHEVVTDDVASNEIYANETKETNVSNDGFVSLENVTEATDVVPVETSVDKEQKEDRHSGLTSEPQSNDSVSSELSGEAISQPLSPNSNEEALSDAAVVVSEDQISKEPAPSEEEVLEAHSSLQTDLSPDISGEITDEANQNAADIESDQINEEVEQSEEKDIDSNILAQATPSSDVSAEIIEEAASYSSSKIDTNSQELDTKANSENEVASESIENSSLINAANGSAEPLRDYVPEAAQAATSVISPALVKQLREETGAGMMDCKKALSETGGDIVKAQEYLRKKGLASADKKASRVTAEGRIGSYIHDGRIGVLIEVNCETDFVARGDIFKELVEDLAMQVAACPQVEYINIEDVPAEIVDKEREIEMEKEDLLSKPEQIRLKIVDGRISKRLGELALLEQPFIKDDKVLVKNWVKQAISTIGENIKVKRFVRYNLGEGLEKKNVDFAAEVAAQTAGKPKPVTSVKQEPAITENQVATESPAKVVVSAALVKKLREETGAGMMDCKKALSETGGDFEKAQEYLRKKGLSAADKKSSRIAAEGRIGSYVHDSRIGVLVEVNCETDFVGRSEAFKELVADLGMEVVACPQVQYVSIEDIPESIVDKEKQLEMQREDLQSKPENIREKIVEGRITKRLGELALLEQPFIKNDSLVVKDLVKQTVATLGENIKVRRFARFTLGEAV